MNSAVTNWRSSWFKRASRYELHDIWRIVGTLDEVAELMFDTESLPEWCPAFRSVDVVAAGDENRIGRVYDVRVKGPLPYSLKLSYRVRERVYPHYFIVDVTGDFEGEGHGSFQQVGNHVEAKYRLIVTIRRPLIRYLSIAIRPLLVMQHTWLIWRTGRRANQIIQKRRHRRQED